MNIYIYTYYKYFNILYIYTSIQACIIILFVLIMFLPCIIDFTFMSRLNLLLYYD